MATKKTRKRAYIPPSSEVVNRRERTASTRTRTASTRSAGRQAYEYPVPSLKRTLRRLPIYFLLIFALQYYLLGTGKKPIPTDDRVLFAAMQSGMVTLLFAPFMHMMDRIAYGRYQKRAAAAKRS